MKNNIKVHLFVSRNKDNRNIENFRQRKYAFIAEENENVDEKFRFFVNQGKENEYSRHYVSLNARNEEKIREELMIRLIRSKPPVEKIANITAGIACLPECAAEHKWLLDFDSSSDAMFDEFLDDVKEYFAENEYDQIKTQKTPNGFAVSVPHGFDQRELSKKWLSVFENKRDAMLFLEGRKRSD